MIDLTSYRTPDGVVIPMAQWSSMRATYLDEQVADALCAATAGMPMPDADLTEARALKAFRVLRDTPLTELLVPGPITLLRCPETVQPGYHTRLRPPGNVASNYFFHKLRLRTPKANVPSAWEKWHDDDMRLRVCRRFLRLKGVDRVDNANIRLALHMTGATPAQFKPGVAKAVYDLTGAKRVLDFSMGWGDRLAGFCASSAEHYLGIDPNPDLHPLYQQQVALYGGGSKTFDIRYAAAEDAELPTGSFDLVFTSPPYFGMERYAEGTGNESAQSWSRYPTSEQWLEGFLRPVITRSWAALRPGGVLAINLADITHHREQYPLCAWLQRVVQALPSAEFKFALGMRLQGANYSGEKRGQVSGEPIWIWTKGSRELPAVRGLACRDDSNTNQEIAVVGKTRLDLDQLRELHTRGMHPDEASRRLGCDPGTVIQQWHNMGLPWIRKSDDLRKKLTDDQEKEIIALYTAGAGGTILARKYGVDKGTIYSVLRRTGTGTRSVASRRVEHKHKKAVISERDLDIRARYETGALLQDIADVVGVSYCTVTHSLKKQGAMIPEAKGLRVIIADRHKNKGLGKGSRTVA